jgi:hypothetical protein
MDANCNILPTSTGATGCTLGATMATIVTVSMANANSNNKRKQQQKKHRFNDTCTTRHACNNHWTSSKSSCLAEPVTPSLMTKDKCKQ